VRSSPLAWRDGDASGSSGTARELNCARDWWTDATSRHPCFDYEQDQEHPPEHVEVGACPRRCRARVRRHAKEARAVPARVQRRDPGATGHATEEDAATITTDRRR